MENKLRLCGRVMMELTRAFFITGIVFTVIGLPGFIASLILHIKSEDQLYLLLFIITGIVGLSGIMIIVSVLKTAFKMEKSGSTFVTLLNDDGLVAQTFSKDNKVDEIKFNYSDVLYYKETKSYVFLFLNRKQSWPLTKEEGLIDFLESKEVKRK